jgi:isoleucyl-tRNA synthetase
MDFNKFEEDIINFWNQYNLSSKIINNKKDSPKWEFLDGPPFVNGTPHHGHLLVSSIKDTMARYMSQKGYQISYQIGFDCHGLPLEQEAEKTVGKASPNDSIEKLVKFNDQCRHIISNCSEVWYDSLGRLGRQFDKTQTYHTANFSYMKSLWWGFKKLWDQELIYCSKKVMAYSPLCETPLSNFEASSNYQDRTDISVYVKFQVENSDENLLIWTTTPWSLFANQGICVNPELTYCLIKIESKDFTDNIWICENLIEKFCVNEFSNYVIVKKVLGLQLKGIKYKPIFSIDGWNNYQVYVDTFVQSSTGTGIVHMAPMFGEDDMRVMKTNQKVSGFTDEHLPESIIDSQVKFTKNWILGDSNINGRFVMDTSTDIVIYLKKNKIALKSEKIKHSYPYCWRSDHPLIYLATDAWFMNVQKIIPDILENNKKINWYPPNIGTDRFANWIKDAPDWCLSRNRVWGTPIPIWTSKSGHMICVGSVEQLEELCSGTSKRKFNDIHLDKINDVVFELNGEKYYRTFGVLDCWFESGMAGLSRFGYPECVDKSYPVDFIAESLDQTRGWFYTLNVLSTALNNKPAYKNVIVSGLILAADGKKMSKRLGNYTNPNEIIKKYGVDVFRLYLIGSPASKAESFCFQDSDLSDITRKLLPYYNANLLLKECIDYAATTFDDINWIHNQSIKSTDKLDLWIQNKFMELSKCIYSHMEKLELTFVPKLIFEFIDHLTNVYVKLSRERLKGHQTETDTKESLSTLWFIFNKFNILLAPFIPHLAEHFNISLYNMIKLNKSYDSYTSVHLEQIDLDYIKEYQLNQNLLKGFYSVIELFESVRNIRQQINRRNFYPIISLELYTDSREIYEFTNIIHRELNIKKLDIYPTDSIDKQFKANRSTLGKAYKKDAKKYINMIESGDINWEGCMSDFYTFDYIVDDKKNMIGTKFNYIDSTNKIKQSVVYVNIETNHQTDMEAEINNIRRQINNLRKEMGLKIFNKIKVIFERNEYWNTINKDLLDLLKSRLCTDIEFTEHIDDFKIIKTFNEKEIKVLIKII